MPVSTMQKAFTSNLKAKKAREAIYNGIAKSVISGDFDAISATWAKVTAARVTNEGGNVAKRLRPAAGVTPMRDHSLAEFDRVFAGNATVGGEIELID